MNLRDFFKEHGLDKGMTILQWMGVKDLAIKIATELHEEKKAELATPLLRGVPTISAYCPTDSKILYPREFSAAAPLFPEHDLDSCLPTAAKKS